MRELNNTKPAVVVLGRSQMCEEIAKALSAGCEVRCGPPADLLVVGSDGWADEGAHDRVRQGRDPWLPVQVIAGRALIGPTVRPGTLGCDWCARLRREAARDEKTASARLRERYGARLSDGPASYLATFAAAAAAALVAAEVDGLRRGGPIRTANAVIEVRLDSLATSVHRFLPHPFCPMCGGLPEDTPEEADFKLQVRLKTAPYLYRIRRLEELESSLSVTYVDRESGLIRKLEKAPIGPYPYVGAPLAMSGMDVNGYGRALDYRTCELTAITEALERHGGARPGGKRSAVRGSFQELKDRAVDPRSFGLYPSDRYDQSGFTMLRYHDDLKLDWVWGYSFARRGPILVPETYAYYRTHHYDERKRQFVYEISNGCALGSCPEEAILHGLIELVERDAFLMTWYASLPVPELDLGSAASPRIAMMIERLTHELGYRVRAFNTTMEHGIPSVWAMAVHPEDDFREAKVLCGGGAGFDPERALEAALLELGTMIPWQRQAYLDDFERVSRMVDDPDEVKTMNDHSLLYCHPRVFRRFDFLLASTVAEPIEESFRGSFRPANSDLGVDLVFTVNRFLALGLDVIAVDQTTSEHRAGGFNCAKVIVPGLLPMTFGHRNRRVDGLPRLLHVPHRLGYRHGPLAMADLNVLPHPFP